MKGVIVRILPNRGYGFIRCDDGLSCFMHATEVEPLRDFDIMREGSAVEFQRVPTGKKGNQLRATHVKLRARRRK